MKLPKRKPGAFSFRPYTIALEDWIDKQVKAAAAKGYGPSKTNWLR